MKIYVELQGEGTEVWRPVEAVHLGDDMYRIVQENAQPEDERWQFGKDSLVRCESKKTQEGDLILVAQEQVNEKPQS